MDMDYSWYVLALHQVTVVVINGNDAATVITKYMDTVIAFKVS